MAGRAKWMPFYVGDYLQDTGRLTTEGHGAYLLLILEYWATGKALLDDDVQLAASARMTQEAWSKLRPILERFFIVADGVWTHGRIEAELAKARRLIEAGQARAAKGNATRWGQKDRQGIVQGSLDDTSADTSDDPPLHLQKKDSPKAPPSAAPAVPDDASGNERPIDLKAEIWRRGKAFLARAGLPAERSGPLLGKWRRDHGDGAVLDALTRAEAEAASDAVPFIEACLRGKTRNGGQRSDEQAERRRASVVALGRAALDGVDPGEW